MKISELIIKLEQFKANYGDIIVSYRDHSDGCWRDVDEIVPRYPVSYHAGMPIDDADSFTQEINVILQ